MKPMDRPEGTGLEAGQRFVQEAVHFMRGYGLDAACGCGYLSLCVGEEGNHDRALREGRDLTEFRARGPGRLPGSLLLRSMNTPYESINV